MRSDIIEEIGIDVDQRLYIKPSTEKFTMVYRTATEVHWNQEKQYLYSAIPREWSYLDWYRHIIDVIKNECFCSLSITDKTIWTRVPVTLKKEILKNKNDY